MYSNIKKIKNEHWDSDIVDKFKCSICYLVMQPEIIETICNHKFCYDCLNMIAITNQSIYIKCPLCRQELSMQKDLIINEEETRKIMESKIKCEKCKKEFLYKNHKDHKCDFNIIKCKYCEFNVYEKDYLLHTSRCNNICHKCKIHISKNDIHLCGKDVISCYNSGCHYKNQRSHIYKHYAICKYKIINCKWCERNIMLKDVKIHNKYCIAKYRICNKCKLHVPISKNFYCHQNECTFPKKDSSSQLNSSDNISDNVSEDNNDDNLSSDRTSTISSSRSSINTNTQNDNAISDTLISRIINNETNTDTINIDNDIMREINRILNNI